MNEESKHPSPSEKKNAPYAPQVHEISLDKQTGVITIKTTSAIGSRYVQEPKDFGFRTFINSSVIVDGLNLILQGGHKAVNALKHPSPSPTIKEGEQQEETVSATTGSEFGSGHWFNTLMASIKHAGEYLQDNGAPPKEETLKAWGTLIYERSNELLDWFEKYQVSKHIANWQKNQQPKGEQKPCKKCGFYDCGDVCNVFPDAATPSMETKERGEPLPKKSPLDILNEKSEEFGFSSWYAACNYQDLEAMNMVPQKACQAYANKQTTTLQTEIESLKQYKQLYKEQDGLLEKVTDRNILLEAEIEELKADRDALQRDIDMRITNRRA